LLGSDLIQRCFKHAAKHGSAIPAIEIKDSLRQVDGASNTAVNRKDFRIIQTPQCFRSESIIEAYRQAYSTEFTDDASVLEKLGKAIHLVEGEEKNIKITYPSDMQYAEVVLS
jgi:2-C-methyl-D-erythritol 4-phosphate cytidylyltransferase